MGHAGLRRTCPGGPGPAGELAPEGVLNAGQRHKVSPPETFWKTSESLGNAHSNFYFKRQEEQTF